MGNWRATLIACANQEPVNETLGANRGFSFLKLSYETFVIVKLPLPEHPAPPLSVHVPLMVLFWKVPLRVSELVGVVPLELIAN